MGEQRLPVADSVGFDAQQIDVGCGTEETVLQVLAKSVINGQRDDERGDTGRDSNNRNDSNDSDYGLAALGPQIPRGNKEFKLHREEYRTRPHNGQISL